MAQTLITDKNLATSGTMPAWDGSALTNLPAGGDKRNFIIDGDLTQWPEGSSARALGGSGGYTSALLYGLEDYSSGSATVERSTDVPTVAQSNHSSSYSALAKCTLDAAPGSSQQCFLAYRITGSDYRKIHAQQVTISFWAKTSAQNNGHTYYLVLRNSAFNRHYVTSFTVTSSWQQFTKTITLDNSGTWLFTEADIGMEIRFQLGKESTYANTTADAWGSGVGAGVSGMSNFLNHTSNEFYLSQFQLVKGSSAPDSFVSEPIATVQDQVAWYVEELNPNNNNHCRFGPAMCRHSTSIQGMISFAPKRISAPMVSLGSGVAGSYGFINYADLNYAGTATPTFGTAQNTAKSGFFTFNQTVGNSGSGNPTAGHPGLFRAFASTGTILIDARH